MMQNSYQIVYVMDIFPLRVHELRRQIYNVNLQFVLFSSFARVLYFNNSNCLICGLKHGASSIITKVIYNANLISLSSHNGLTVDDD